MAEEYKKKDDKLKDENETLNNKLNDEFHVTKQYLHQLKDDSTIKMIEAHRSVDYDIESNPDGFADELADKLEEQLEEQGYDRGRMDARSFKGVMIKHYGVTRDKIHEFVKAHGDQARKKLIEQIEHSQSALIREHYHIIADDHLKTEKDRKAAAIYLGLHDLPEYNATGLTHEHLKHLFYVKGEVGKISADNLPTEAKKTVKKEDKDKKKK